MPKALRAQAPAESRSRNWLELEHASSVQQEKHRLSLGCARSLRMRTIILLPSGSIMFASTSCRNVQAQGRSRAPPCLIKAVPLFAVALEASIGQTLPEPHVLTRTYCDRIIFYHQNLHTIQYLRVRTAKHEKQCAILAHSSQPSEF